MQHSFNQSSFGIFARQNIDVGIYIYIYLYKEETKTEKKNTPWFTNSLHQENSNYKYCTKCMITKRKPPKTK